MHNFDQHGGLYMFPYWHNVDNICGENDLEQNICPKVTVNPIQFGYLFCLKKLKN